MFNFKKKQEWKTEALEIGLVLYPISSKNMPSRDGTCLKWDQILKVVTYKTDLLTTDLACMAFENISELRLEIHEELEGFEAVLMALPKYLKGFPEKEEYWGSLLLPPFERNEKIVWER